jgi:hypothetical protein
VRNLGRILVALLVLLVAVVGILFLLLERYVEGETLRARVETLAEEALEREVRYADLDLRLFPPSLVMRQLFVAGATPEGAALLEADEVELRVAVAALLARTLVIDSLVIEGARLHLVRTKDGVELPWPTGDEASGEETPAEEAAEAQREGLDFAIRTIELEDATLVFDDRAVSSPVTWELTQVDLQLHRASPDALIDVELEVEMAGGGRLAGRGRGAPDGRLEFSIELDAFPLDPIGPYFAGASELAGTLTGVVSGAGVIGNPDPIALDLELRDANVRLDEFALRGRVALKAEITGGLQAPVGGFEADATQAEVRWAEVFRKPPGQPATLTGRFVPGPEGRLDVDDVHLRVQKTEARGKLELGERTRVVMSVPAFELSEWHPLVAALAEYQLSGPLAVSEFEVLTKPLAVRGELNLKGVQARIPEAGSVGLRGSLVGTGEAIRTRDLVFLAGEEVVAVEGEITDLEEAWSYRLRARAEQVETRSLLSTFSSDADGLEGPLTFDGDLSGAFAGEDSFAESLGGSVRFDITPGRLQGISILEATFRRLDRRPAVGLLKGLSLPGLGTPIAKGLERYYTDHFDSLSATLDVDGGTARTEDFRLVTPYYSFEMEGLIRFADLGLDARGQLVLGRELTGTIAGLVGLEKMPLVQQVAIPIPRLRGTLTDPEPEPDWEGFWKVLLGNLPGLRAVGRLRSGVEKGLSGR